MLFRSLTVDKNSVAFTEDGGSQFITLTTDAGAWNIEMDAQDWLEVSPMSGNRERAMVTLKTTGKHLDPKSVVLTIKSGNAKEQVTVTQEGSEFLYTFNVSCTDNEFTEEGGEVTVYISGNAPTWKCSSSAEWLTPSALEGDCSANITVRAALNETGAERTDSVVFTAEGAKTQVLVFTQKDRLFPSYNTDPIAPDNSGMTRTASQIAASMYLGWNLGNSLEATGSETSWGNAKTTKRLIDSVKVNGINAVRIPCSWNQYQSNSKEAKIKDSWLARVKEVVDYCVANEMYVVLNAHWDGGWLEENCVPAKQYEVNARQRAYWEQIATYFRNYDEHLIFAGTNEPNVDTKAQMEVLLAYEQTFIDAVRSTGGKNSYRTLIVQGPCTDIDKTNSLMKTLPVDPTPNRMMVEVHYYTPYHFCLMEKDETWGNMFFFWGTGFHYSELIDGVDRNATWGEESDMRALLGKMRTQFVNKGIPMIMGEYCATRRSALSAGAQEAHFQSRAYFHEYTTQKAKEYGLVPFYWDNGYGSNHASGIFNRTSGAVIDTMTLNALKRGAAAGNYPYRSEERRVGKEC